MHPVFPPVALPKNIQFRLLITASRNMRSVSLLSMASRSSLVSFFARRSTPYIAPIIVMIFSASGCTLSASRTFDAHAPNNLVPLAQMCLDLEFPARRGCRRSSVHRIVKCPNNFLRCFPSLRVCRRAERNKRCTDAIRRRPLPRRSPFCICPAHPDRGISRSSRRYPNNVNAKSTRTSCRTKVKHFRRLAHPTTHRTLRQFNAAAFENLRCLASKRRKQGPQGHSHTRCALTVGISNKNQTRPDKEMYDFFKKPANSSCHGKEDFLFFACDVRHGGCQG